MKMNLNLIDGKIEKSASIISPGIHGNLRDLTSVPYEDHKLPSVVTRDLALSGESRLAARHSRLANRDSRLSMLSDSWSAG